jgi:hypothetical protein
MMMSRGCVNNSKFTHSKFKMKDVSLFKKPERIITEKKTRTGRLHSKAITYAQTK